MPLIWINKETYEERKRLRNCEQYGVWKKLVKERDLHRCQLCNNSPKTVEVHHIKPFAEYPKLRFNPNNGITLCQKCHLKVHKYDKIKERV